MKLIQISYINTGSVTSEVKRLVTPFENVNSKLLEVNVSYRRGVKETACYPVLKDYFETSYVPNVTYNHTITHEGYAFTVLVGHNLEFLLSYLKTQIPELQVLEMEKVDLHEWSLEEVSK